MKEIVQEFEDKVREEYENIKSRCDTYGKLETEIYKTTQEIRFENPKIGNWLKKELRKLYEKDVEHTPIKRK